MRVLSFQMKIAKNEHTYIYVVPESINSLKNFLVTQ